MINEIQPCAMHAGLVEHVRLHASCCGERHCVRPVAAHRQVFAQRQAGWPTVTCSGTYSCRLGVSVFFGKIYAKGKCFV